MSAKPIGQSIILRASALVAAALLLAACNLMRKEPDPDAFRAVQRASEPPRPVEVVEVPKPLPLPGQLKPIPQLKPPRPEPLDPEVLVDQANREARQEPSPDGYLDAVQVYPYAEGALYQVYAAPEQVSDIALQPGEKLVAVSAGDTVRWIIGDTTSGTGEGERVHILVKPARPDVSTNLVITTDRRAYHLELHATEATYMARVAWDYPQDRLVALQQQNRAAEIAEATVADAGLTIEQLNFNYRITGDEPAWRPLRAFDDGQKVFLQFPRGLAQSDAPPLFVLGPEEEAELVNYRVRGRYYVVDHLFDAAELRLGGESQEVVRITRLEPDDQEPSWREGG